MVVDGVVHVQRERERARVAAVESRRSRVDKRRRGQSLLLPDERGNPNVQITKSTAMQPQSPLQDSASIHLPKMQKSHPHLPNNRRKGTAGPPTFIPPSPPRHSRACFARPSVPLRPTASTPPVTDWLSLIDSASSPVASRRRGPRNEWSGAVGVAVWSRGRVRMMQAAAAGRCGECEVEAGGMGGALGCESLWPLILDGSGSDGWGWGR